MSTYTLRLSVDQYELDESSEQYNPKEYTILQDFDYQTSRVIPVESIDLWRNIVVDRPEMPVLALHINSDQEISIRLNGGNEVGVTTDLILKGRITSVEVKNTSGTAANVLVEMWS